MKILSLIGARPQFIKEAVVHKELKKEGIKEVLVHSGQHYDVNMSDIFFVTLGIRKPDYFLDVGSGKHGEMTGKIMIEFEKVVIDEKPDVILVYGDTNTTLAGALVGAKLKVPVAHVEAGLRQEPKDMPEEINRVITDRVSSILFCPSMLAVENLRKENILNGVYFVGDVMYDLYKVMEPKFEYEVYEALNLPKDNYVVVTLHRDFNVDDREKFEQILRGISKVAEALPVVFPIHPRTQKRVKEFGLTKYLEKMIVLEPLDYLNLMGLVKRSKKIITDSGGLQKEAYFAGKQALVIMPDTSWRELVDVGWNVLIDSSDLCEQLPDLVLSNRETEYYSDIYGKGDAGKRIVGFLKANID